MGEMYSINLKTETYQKQDDDLFSNLLNTKNNSCTAPLQYRLLIKAPSPVVRKQSFLFIPYYKCYYGIMETTRNRAY